MAAADLRARRRELVARDIERTAVDLFAGRGYEAVSVDEVAAAAGTSQRTFFRYFDSKDDVLLRYERRIHERFLAALRQRPAGEGAVTALRNAFVSTSTVAPADLDDVIVRARVVAASPVLAARARGERAARNSEVAGILASRDGAAADDRYLVIAAAMTAVAQATWDAWLADEAAGNPAPRIAAALDLLAGGFAGLDRPAGRGRAPSVDQGRRPATGKTRGVVTGTRRTR